MKAVAMPAAHRRQNRGFAGPLWNVTPGMSAFEKNPLTGMMPAGARAPISIAREVQGITFPSPPICRMSFVWTAWITEPAERNRRALKNAWFVRWNRAALYPAVGISGLPRAASDAIRYAPAPKPRNMYASWLIVENAITRLMS